MTQRFSGLGLHLGNLSRLSDAKSRSISAEESNRREGKGRGWPRTGPGLSTRAGSGAAGRFRPRNASPPGRRFCSATSRGRAPFSRSGSRRANVRWRDLVLRISLGRPGAAVGRGAAWRFFRLRLGPIRAGEFACRLRQSGPGVQLLLGDAFSPGPHVSPSRTAIRIRRRSYTGKSTMR